MKPEIEAKFLNISHDEIREKLKTLGAVCESPMRRMRRKNYDYPDRRLDKKRNAWIRVRDEGSKITMSYKQLNSREIDGMHEVNLTVDSFDSACHFLEVIGLQHKATQETGRESWRLGDIEIELDEWPWIAPFVELEGPDEASLQEAARALGLDWEHVLFGSVEIAYQAEYDVTEQEVDDWSEVVFGPVPDWLEKKRRH